MTDEAPLIRDVKERIAARDTAQAAFKKLVDLAYAQLTRAMDPKLDAGERAAALGRLERAGASLEGE